MDYGALGLQASQAAEAAEVHLPAIDQLQPAASTPEPSRHTAVDASSEYQHRFLDRRSYAELVGSPAPRSAPGSPNTAVQHRTLLQPASAARLKQLSPSQNRPTPASGRNTKKAHPLYAPMSAPRQGNTQHRKAKQKADTVFAIRQPASASASKAPAAKQSASDANALRQLIGAAHQDCIAENTHDAGADAPAQEMDHTALRQHARPSGLAGLLGAQQPPVQAEAIESDFQPGAAAQTEPQQQSPARSCARRQSLLDVINEGEMPPPDVQVPKGSAGPAAEHTPMQAGPAAGKLLRHIQAAQTPSMMLQRQFIAKLQDSPAQASSQLAKPASGGSLCQRLNSILQNEKAHRTQVETTGGTGWATMTVTITQQQLEGHVMKCRCYRNHDKSDLLFVMFNKGVSKDVELYVGNTVKVHAPWTVLQPEGYSSQVILCFHASA